MKNTFSPIYTRQGIFYINLQNIECWIDHFSESQFKESKKIFIQLDPNEYLNLNEEIIKRQKEFDYILTFEPEILNNCNNAVLFEYGTSWVNPEKYSFPDKKFSLSFVCNTKYHNQGHILRHEIYYNQDKINIPIDFYLSSKNPDSNDLFYKQSELKNLFNNKILGESKFPLFDSMFSVCVENVKKDYYFSEKLIDCFLCKSIPVYYGCDNISNYFNTDGMVLFHSIEELLSKTDILTPDFYYSKSSVIDSNYAMALKYINYNQRLIDKISELIV